MASRRDSSTTNSTKEWKPEWHNATPKELGSLKDIADSGDVKLVTDKLQTLDGEYKLWYYSSQDGKFFKVVISKSKPTTDMSLTGNAPALGMAVFTVGAAKLILKEKWTGLANQIEKATQS